MLQTGFGNDQMVSLLAQKRKISREAMRLTKPPELLSTQSAEEPDNGGDVTSSNSS
jgi:hypothetical protein